MGKLTTCEIRNQVEKSEIKTVKQIIFETIVKNVIAGLDDKWGPPKDPLEMVITNLGKT